MTSLTFQAKMHFQQTRHGRKRMASRDVLAQIAGRAVAVEDIDGATWSIRHIAEAYRTIRQFLRINFDDRPADIRKFLVAFLKRVKLIRIVTPNLAHALKVFETINDRGVGLNAMDLLKNLLFMKTQAHDYARLKDRWKRLVNLLDEADEKPLRFLRYFVMSQYTIDSHRGLREDEIYDWFVDHASAIGIDRAPLAVTDLD